MQGRRRNHLRLLDFVRPLWASSALSDLFGIAIRLDSGRCRQRGQRLPIMPHLLPCQLRQPSRRCVVLSSIASPVLIDTPRLAAEHIAWHVVSRVHFSLTLAIAVLAVLLQSLSVASRRPSANLGLLNQSCHHCQRIVAAWLPTPFVMRLNSAILVTGPLGFLHLGYRFRSFSLAC